MGDIMVKKTFLAFIIIVLNLSVQFFSQVGGPDIEHLLFLRDDFKVKDEVKKGYWIYADLKEGRYVHTEAVGEGVTCVDDVARAGIFYLNMYENTENQYYADLARECTDFVSSMKAENGDYYNFVFSGGEINKNGITSRPSANWWALRAMWLFARNFEVYSNKDFDIHDAAYSKLCLDEIERTASLFRDKLDGNGLIRGYTDLTSLYVLSLGIVCVHSAEFSEKWMPVIIKCADGIISKCAEDGIFPGIIDEGNTDFNFHGWGSRQVQALAIAYEATKNIGYLDAAEKMAISLYPSMITFGPFYELRKNGLMPYPMIAYAAEAAVSSLSELFRVTQKEEYGYMACLCASFFFGNNVLGQSMFGGRGEGFDGMEAIFINRNSGAESTVSYLIGISLIQSMPAEYRIFTSSKRFISSGPFFFDAENMDAGISSLSVESKDGFTVLRSDSMKLRKDFKPYSSEYDFFAFGDFRQNTVLKAYIGSRKAETVSPYYANCIHIGSVACESFENSKITFVSKSDSENLINQIVLVPAVFFQILACDDGTYLWAFNRKSEPASIEIPQLGHISVEPGEFLVRKVVFEYEVAEKFSGEHHVYSIENGSFGQFDLTDVFNNDGIGSERNPANLDNYNAISGAYLPSEEITAYLSDGSAVCENIPFIINVEEGSDNFTANGQKLITDINADRLYIAGCCDHGDFSGDIEVEYYDSDPEYFTLSFPDWCSFTEKTGILLKLPFRYSSKSQKEWIDCGIFVRTLDLKGKRVKSIGFPVLPTMHIFAITFGR